MSKRFVIGVTGGIATGKSSVLQELKRQGIPTLAADDLAHACLRPGHPAYRQVVRHFGPEILGPGRQIDRKRLGAIVFAKPRERHWLENQIHPWVLRAVIAFIRKHPGMTALDIPLLYEAGYQKKMDVVVVVVSSLKAQLARLKRRNSLDKASALLRIRAQMPLAAKRKRADFVIRNDSSLSSLRRQVHAVLQQIQENQQGK
jgi:dephospho-CoA kinase